MEASDHLPHDLMVESDGVLDLMEDQDLMLESDDIPDLMEDKDDFLRGLPFTRTHHILNVDHKVKNTEGTKTTSFFLDIKNRRQRLWRSAEGVVTTISDFNVPHDIEFPYGNSDFLESVTERDTLVSSILAMLELEELSELQSLISLSLLNMASTAKDVGYITMDFVLVLEYATVDTYDENAVGRDQRESAVFMSSLEALSLQGSEDGNSSNSALPSVGLNIHKK